MKNTGIWIDKNRAVLIFLEGATEQIKEIPSNLDHFKIHGGSGSRFKGGPQDVVQDSKYLEREKHQLRIYFKNVANELQGEQDLVIFGPAQIKDKFYAALETNFPNIHKQVTKIATADSMSENQMKAWVRDYYN